MLANPRAQLGDTCSTAIIGSGYGGAITACRLAAAGEPVCLLERGAEWAPGAFPDTLTGLYHHARSADRPLGLYEYLPFHDIDVIKGSGLGGTSLINAAVAFRPDDDYFGRAGSRWPLAIRRDWEAGALQAFYDRAERALGARVHPRALSLAKAQVLGDPAARRPGDAFAPVKLAVSFSDGANAAGVLQSACTDCGDCFTGCNVGAKNTLAMNYLPAAKRFGAEMYTGIEVDFIERSPSGVGYVLHYRRLHEDRAEGELQQLVARRVILAAGSLGSTQILLRSAGRGLPLSRSLGQHFSGNGNFFGASYNGDRVTDVLGFGHHDDARAAVAPGPAIVAAIRCDGDQPFDARTVIEDLVIPRALVDAVRIAFPGLAATIGAAAPAGLPREAAELERIARDLAGWNATGALNRTMIYLYMRQDGGDGVMRLDDAGALRIDWPGVSERASFRAMDEALRARAAALGATYLPNPRWEPLLGRNLITAHPLGGCCMADDADGGVTDDRGRVFDGQGGLHDGLLVADGAIVPECIGRNPLLTISALAERIAASLGKL
jgi:cholesterol oxidase